MLTWNVPNWITVILMVALGYAVVALAAQLVRGRLTGGSPDLSSPPGLSSLGDFIGLGGSNVG